MCSLLYRQYSLLRCENTCWLVSLRIDDAISYEIGLRYIYVGRVLFAFSLDLAYYHSNFLGYNIASYYPIHLHWGALGIFTYTLNMVYIYIIITPAFLIHVTSTRNTASSNMASLFKVYYISLKRKKKHVF